MEPNDQRERVPETEPAPAPATEAAGTEAAGTEVVTRFSPARRAFELVYIIFAAICVLLILRIVLKLLAANTAVAFTGFIYGITNFLMGPFNGLLHTWVNGRTVFEGSAIIALLVYALVGYLLSRLVAIMFQRDVTVARGSGSRYRTY